MTFAFKDTPNTACIVCHHVLAGKNPITLSPTMKRMVCGNFCVQKTTLERMHASFP